MLENTHVQEAQEQINAVIAEVQKVVVGQSRLVRNLTIALLAKGHVLLE